MNNWTYCVGFELQYSPLQQVCIEHLGHALHGRVNEFIFDVLIGLDKGQPIQIMFSNSQHPTQQLLGEVKSCKKLDIDHYRIKVSTTLDSTLISDSAGLVCLPIIRGDSLAHEIVVRCPSCKNETPYRYIANQEGDWEQGILPMYNCSTCGTTRALPGLVDTLG